MWSNRLEVGSTLLHPAVFICERLGIREPGVLLIDTGASTTTFFAEDIGLSITVYQELPSSATVLTSVSYTHLTLPTTERV